MWGPPLDGGGADGVQGHGVGSFSLMAAPSASHLTSLFSPQKPSGHGGSSIPEEFLQPPPQTFGAQLFGGGERAAPEVLVHEEVDIKPVILAPSPPPTEAPEANDEIDLLMDELLKDVEVNVEVPSKDCDPSTPVKKAPGLSIRKDIFMSPKAGAAPVIDLGDSPPKEGDQTQLELEMNKKLLERMGAQQVQSHRNFQDFLSGSKQVGANLISSTAAQIFQQSLSTNQNQMGFTTSPGFSSQLIGHLNQQTNGVRMSTGSPGSGIMMPLRNIAPKPSSQPGLIPGFSNPASFLPQAGLPNPTTSLSQNDMRVAYDQLKSLEEHQAQKKRQAVEALSRQWSVGQSPNVSIGSIGPNGGIGEPIGFNTNAAEFLFRPEVVHERETPVKEYKRYNRPDRTPLFHDPTLPPGWSRKITQRKTGGTAGGWDTYIIDPHGKRFRSRQEIRRHFELIQEVYLQWEDFDFNPFGSKGQVVEDDQNVPFWEEMGQMDASDFLKTEMVE